VWVDRRRPITTQSPVRVARKKVARKKGSTMN
jgi:hypothetical protein